MQTKSTQLLVLGGGPGGYVAAIRAGQLGIPCIVVEGGQLGGTCLNVGCIPSKALLHAADEYARARRWTDLSPIGISVASAQLDIRQTVHWKDDIVSRLTGGVAALLKKSGVEVVPGWGTIVDGKTVDVRTAQGEALRISCEHLLVATGSVPVELADLPFGGDVVSSTGALSPGSLPQRLVVVGAGYIGLELGTAYRKLGAEVTIVEAGQRVLPGYDESLTRPVAASLKRMGADLRLGCTVQGRNDDGALRLLDAKGVEFSLAADRILVAVGRQPRTAGFGLEGLQLGMNGSAIAIDGQCRTSMTHVWAIGDVAGEPMLAHRAMAQGEMVAEIISGKKRWFNPASIPAVCFTDPEIVVAGLSAQEARGKGIEVMEAQFPFSANGRAMTLESTEGFVKVTARKDNHLILGWQAVGQGVAELASAFSQSLEMGAVLEDVASTIHAHPTLGEAVQESALRALGHALHI
jgi:dihydrolipoamide dehydrogenase